MTISRRLGISLFALAACVAGLTANAQTPAAPVAPDTTPTITVDKTATPAPAPAAQPETTPTLSQMPSTEPVVTGSGGAPKRFAYSSCYVNGPYIAMTFDDGPSALLTPKLLDMLKERNIKVTFFLIGENVKAHPEIVQRMIAEGHEIGNHSWNHPALSKLSMAAADQQISDTNKVIQAAVGQTPTLMRPPYGATTPYLTRRINEIFGMKVILWSVDPLDWKYRNSQHVYDEILKQVHPGAIILSHDIHATTVAAMPQVFDALLAKGYKFVTVSQLIAMDQPRPRKSAPTAATAAPPAPAASAAQ